MARARNPAGRKVAGHGAGARNRERSAARLAAVQALYQMELTGAGVDSVVEEFRHYRLGRELDGMDYARADAAFFAALVTGVVARQVAIDKLVNGTLAEGWRLARLDSILRALLRVGAFELMELSDVPARVVIDEYVDVAHAFFEGAEPGFVNGALDRIAHLLRPDEFSDVSGRKS